MLGQDLSPALAHEADQMVRSLLRDLAELPGIECFSSRDPRFPPLPGVESITAEPGEAPFDLYRRGLESADAAWPTAPETAFSLEELGRLTLTADRILLGTHPDTVRLTGSKLWTSAHLSSCGIPAVPTFQPGDAIPALPGRWVVKPDDGAGAEDTQVVGDAKVARQRLEQKGDRYVAQPWIEGKPLSLSLLCADGKTRLLACNRQHVGISDGTVMLKGISVNGAASLTPLLSPLANQIAAAIPLLWGHAGVDLILSENGPVVLEINPRLTTSYCGLRRAFSQNPAGWVIELLKTGRLPATPSPESGVAVELNLAPANV